MEKITGLENLQEVPPKVLLLYEAVVQLIMEGVDVNAIRVSTITDRAGIGKGTAYDYFDTKEEILACAVIYFMRKEVEGLSHTLAGYESFAEQVAFLLEMAENNNKKQQCLVHYIHTMTDTASFSRLVREKVHMEEMRQYCPTAVFAAMLTRGQKRGEVREDLPFDYMVYVLLSKIVSYMVCVGEECIIGAETAHIRPFIYRSILEELCVTV